MQGVHKVSHPCQMKSDSGANCYHCGKSGHSAAKCRFKDVKCEQNRTHQSCMPHETEDSSWEETTIHACGSTRRVGK